MHILFIYPDLGDPYTMERTGRFHQGIGYISSVLKADGHQTSLLHITKNVGKKELSEEIKRSKADLIAFSSTTHQYPLVQKYSGWIKEETEIPIICGGVHATICPDQVLSSKGIDMVCIGEGEYPMLELARKLEKGESIYGIKNLWIKKPDGTVKKNSVRPLISNLDELPFPDREIFNFKELSKKWLLSSIGSIAEFVAGRGCPFSCTYCCNPVIRKIYKGKGEYVRIRSVGNVLAEIRRVIENYSPDRILFHDDTFTLFHQWIKEFCEKYPKEFDLPFWCNIRVETVNRQILLNLKKAGCEQINIGIESGNEWLRRTVLNRPMTNQQIMKVFRIAHEVGLRTLSFNMVGIPFETPRMVKDTIELNKLVQPDLIQVSIFYPYPNTELWKLCKKNRFLKQTHVYSYYEDHSVLDLPTMSSEQITQFYYNFVDLCLEKSMETYHPVIYKCFRPLLGPKVLRTLRKARNMFRRWGL